MADLKLCCPHCGSTVMASEQEYDGGSAIRCKPQRIAEGQACGEIIRERLTKEPEPKKIEISG